MVKTPVDSRRPTVDSHESPVDSHEATVDSHGSTVDSRPSAVASHESTVDSHGSLSVDDHRPIARAVDAAEPSSDAAILDGIADIARAFLGWTGRLSPEMPLVERLALDSIRQLTLLIEIENRFRVRLDEDDDASIRTVGDLVAVIARKRADRAPDPR